MVITKEDAKIMYCLLQVAIDKHGNYPTALGRESKNPEDFIASAVAEPNLIRGMSVAVADCDASADVLAGIRESIEKYDEQQDAGARAIGKLRTDFLEVLRGCTEFQGSATRPPESVIRMMYLLLRDEIPAGRLRQLIYESDDPDLDIQSDHDLHPLAVKLADQLIQ